MPFGIDELHELTQAYKPRTRSGGTQARSVDLSASNYTVCNVYSAIDCQYFVRTFKYITIGFFAYVIKSQHPPRRMRK